MNLWEVVGLILGSSVATALINNWFGRGKNKADAASTLIDGAVDVVKLKDSIITELRLEFAERERKLAESLNEERSNRRAMDGRIETLETEKKTWKSRWTRSGARILFSNSVLKLLTISTNGWRERISL